MTSPGGSFLEGLSGGLERGVGFRRATEDRRRRIEIEDELRRYRTAEAERQARAGALEEAQALDKTGLAITPTAVPRTPFNPGGFNERPAAPVPERILGMRRDVGAELGGVQGSFRGPPLEAPHTPARIHFGGVEQVGTPRAVVDELGYDPGQSTGSLEGDIARSRQPTTAQAVGHALAGITGRHDLTPVQEGLVGRGAIPASALQPKRYAPTTRAEWLRDQKDLAGLRVGQRATKEDLAAVERQVDDTRAELAAAERRRPKKPLVFIRPEDETSFNESNTAAGQEVTDLRQRLDSLNTVRDRLAADLQGGPGGKRAPSGGAHAPDELDRQYQAALDRGVDPVEAKKVYDRERARRTTGRP